MSIGNPERIAWIDLSRALSVCAVVLMHLMIWAVVPAIGESPSATFLNAFNNFVIPMRMPALLMVSGMLLSGRIRAGWGDLRTRMSAASSLYFYLVWLAIFTVIGALGFWVGTRSLLDFAGQLLAPKTVLWYLFALGVWTVVLSLVRRWSPWLVLSLLLPLAIIAPLLPGVEGVDQYRSVLTAGLYLAGGVYSAPVLRDLPSRALIGMGVIGLLAYAPLSSVRYQVDDVLAQSALSTVVGFLAAPVVFAVSVILASWRPARRLLTYVGRNTLPIYVLHVPMIVMITHTPFWWGLIKLPHLGGVIPIVTTIGIVALAIVIRTAAVRWGASFLFELPASIRSRIRRLSERAGRRENSPDPA